MERKVAIVTGAGAGIGEAIAHRLAEDGFIVVANGRRATNTIKVAETIRSKGYSCKGIVADVSDVGQVKQMVEEVISEFSRIDVLVNNAGIFPARKIQDITSEDFEKTMKVNVSSIFYCVKAVVPYMMERKKGKIINAGSQTSFRQSADTIEYATSKWAVRGLTRTLAAALAPYDITVNAFCPGTVLSPMQMNIAEQRGKAAGLSVEEYFEKRISEIPLGRAQPAEEIAALVSYLASDAANNMTGQNIMLNGGQVMC